MVTIHDKKATTFDTLGLGTLLPSSCVVSEELNGAYELKMEHPYDPDGKWERISEENIIQASTPRGMQPFRIYHVNPCMDSISVNARHIFYDLLDNSCDKISAAETNAGKVIRAIKNKLNYEMLFSFYTDIETETSFSSDRMNPVQLILSTDDGVESFVNVFGGEILRDGFRVTMLKSLGKDNGVAIRYGKNLVGLEVDEDISGVTTRIICNNTYNDVGVFDSPYIDLYAHPKIHTICKHDWTSNLEKEAKAMLASGCDLPKVNIKVNFVELTKTEEYKDYAVLEEVNLGDTVTIVNAKMGFHKKAKVISYEWDSMLDRYGKIELGDFIQTIAASITSGMNSGSTAVSDASNVLTLLNEHIEDKDNPHEVSADQVGAAGGTTLTILDPDGNAMEQRSQLQFTNSTVTDDGEKIVVEGVKGDAGSTTNENLLDNWYFADPINQRGLDSYTGAAAYSIDRWKRTSVGIEVTLNDGYITLTNTAQYSRFEQFFELNTWKHAFAGRTFTVSAYCKGAVGQPVRFALYADNAAVQLAVDTATLTSTDWECISVTFTAKETEPTTNVALLFYPALQAEGGSLDVKAIKMEYGEQQTLAEEINGVWMLTDAPPNKQQELAKCQRYFQRFRTETERKTYCEDFRPTMRETSNGQVVKSTITVDGVTYYTASAEL